MLHFDDISLFTQDEKEMHPGLFIRKIEVMCISLKSPFNPIVTIVYTAFNKNVKNLTIFEELSI